MDQARVEEAGVPAERSPQARNHRIPSFLFIMLMLYMLTTHDGGEFIAKHKYQHGLLSLTSQLSNFTAWMNGTESNFTLPQPDPNVLPLVRSLIPDGFKLDPLKASYYSNITGFIHGAAHFHNISEAALPTLNHSLPWKSAAELYMNGSNTTNMMEPLERIGSWNWTASEQVSLSVVERAPHRTANITENIVLVHGRIEFTDSNTAEDMKLDFEGIHFVANGSIYGFAEPANRHIDIRLLPALVPEHMQNETARIILPELAARVQRLANLIDAGVVEDQSDEKDVTTCPFVVYGQLTPARISELSMEELEHELQKPSGLSTVKAPKLTTEVVLLSRECGIMYQLMETEGLRSSAFFRKVTDYSGSAAAAYLILVFLLFRQLSSSRTPSGVSRVSRWTFFIQATLDSFSFAGHVTFAILSEGRPSLSLVAPAFLACVLFYHEAQFSVLIYQVQMPDEVPSPPVVPVVTRANPPGPLEQQQLLPSAAQPVTPNNVLVTQSENGTFWAFVWQNIRSDPQTRLWLTFFIFMTVVVRIIMSPTMSLFFVALTYSSVWVTQIARSIRRGRGSGLKLDYVIGTTIGRLYFMLYFLACPKNVLEVKPRPWSYFLAGFVMLQALVVVLQDLLGPTFFLPTRYAMVKPHDYHPVLPLPDPESAEKSLGDCAICMEAVRPTDSLTRQEKNSEDWEAKATGTADSLEKKRKPSSVGVMDTTASGLFTAVTRQSYSLSPCHHLFHTDCLERWLQIKTICPQCRRPLPPL
ncbi:hypothetical protein C8J56DRAFT_960123 [Mycena floridula]|nr:hypothetical protein C8J56DRAFT_960123 [Mycena floridula]